MSHYFIAHCNELAHKTLVDGSFMARCDCWLVIVYECVTHEIFFKVFSLLSYFLFLSIHLANLLCSSKISPYSLGAFPLTAYLLLRNSLSTLLRNVNIFSSINININYFPKVIIFGYIRDHMSGASGASGASEDVRIAKSCAESFWNWSKTARIGKTKAIQLFLTTNFARNSIHDRMEIGLSIWIDKFG